MAETCLDVVICTYTEERLGDLVASVKSVQNQEFESRQIIVVVDYNPDLAIHLRSLFEDVLVVENTHRKGLSGSRNTGIECSRSPIVAFLDDDAVATPGWLQRIWSSYSDPTVLAVGGAAIPTWETSAPGWFPEEFGWVVGCSYIGQPETVSVVRNLLGCNMSVRREVFDRVGMFSDNLGRIGKNLAGCEETELCIRAVRGVDGGKVVYDPQIVVNHRVKAERTMVTYFLRRCWFEGRSKAYVSALVGSRDGISQERTYLIRTLPRGIVRGLFQMILKGDWGGGARAGFMLIGLFITIAGYLTGRLSQLKSGSVFTLFGKGQAEVSWFNKSIAENLESVGVSEFESELAQPIVDEHLPFATVVVPSVFARLEQLRSCLDSLISLDYPKFEIIVVDNRRDDSDVLPNWFSYDDKVRILRERFPGISAARNRGIKEAAGEVIAFTDDDVEVDVNWLRNLVHSLLSRRDIGCVTGLVLPKDLDTPAKRWFEEYLGGFNRGTEVKLYCPATLDEMRFIGSSKVRRVTCINVESNSVEELSVYQAIARCGAGANMGFRCDALRAAGGFNLALGTGTPARGGEDLAMFAAIFQMHHCVVYDPKAVVYHSHRDSYQELVRQISGSGIGLTAMLTSLVVEDPSHLKAILAKVPLAVFRVIKLRFGSRDTQMTGVPKTFPPSLRWHELVGMLQGPLAYVHSRRSTKRESWTHRFQSNFSESDGIT